MSDADVLREILRREQRWIANLQRVQMFQREHLGKAVTEVQWMGGRELARFSWLGFYWPTEMFWFGYGLHDGAWRPVIEADNRSKYSDLWAQMQSQLAGVWEAVPAEGSLYRRLWSPEGVAGSDAVEFDWLRHRSRELHEYVVSPLQP